MFKPIILIAICWLTLSCNPDPKSASLNDTLTANDTLQHNLSPDVDSTDFDIDPVKVSPDKYKILLENENVRVVEYTLKPGEKDNLHNHPAKSLYTISGGTLRVYAENEAPADFEEVTGSVSWDEKTKKHYCENVGKTTIQLLLTEVKSAQN